MDLFQRSNYSFDLPESLIAAHPLDERTDAKMLVVYRGAKTIEHFHVRDLPKVLPARCVLVANNTKVFRARLQGTRVGSNGRIEFFALKKVGERSWEGLMKSSATIAPGFQFQVGPSSDSIMARVIARNDTSAGAIITAEFSRDPIEAGIGQVPLPPYIVAKRAQEESEIKTEARDEIKNYNTVYAKHVGSVAAPTAGRHFTNELISELKAKGMDWEEITLHVGLGTFKPVTSDDVRQHQMHEEWSEISDEVATHIERAKSEGRKIISIGTTSTRTLEGRAMREPSGPIRLSSGAKPIDLFIHPGSAHDWKLVDGILTNFHLPESTLFMMIATFLGDLDFLKSIYQEAIAEKYRFYSYGDAMLILP
jgi:S-adenosylmethionine:tRNA ribosyltransferase-isomerase